MMKLHLGFSCNKISIHKLWARGKKLNQLLKHSLVKKQKYFLSKTTQEELKRINEIIDV